MSRQQRIDAAYGRRGGGWKDESKSAEPTRFCDVCERPMAAGQDERHKVCEEPADLSLDAPGTLGL